MKKAILLIALGFFSLKGNAQEQLRNSISVPLIRLEANSQTLNGDLNLKFMTGIEYQRFINKWSFGVKYEHGYNKIEENPTNCYDCFYGTGFMREDNVYLSANYSILDFFNSKLKLNTGLAVYYSNLNFSGDYQGGFSGTGKRENSTFNTFGLAPSISIIYYPTERLFISVNSNIRYGWSQEFDANSNQDRKTKEYVLTTPELKVGVRF
ncbi:hypothetical protein ERX46_17365 [Brumimicrobium glaciale]|uniref:Outer membrane protein beta-barrel domain-containing protein n=1 Tax=Brumimicrobium glaciale TaxID=200475 RepID=A0A4Q4KCW2_9FLAO|nr:hypothetical protein [Brumimicrobium glaciale]RYM30851.1 hypothetical protein ERX46_17365 [Brumimicrobium glaciale]